VCARLLRRIAEREAQMVRHEDVWQPGKGRSPPQETERVSDHRELASDH